MRLEVGYGQRQRQAWMMTTVGERWNGRDRLNRERAFTVIELLVVIVTIGLLVALLGPALSRGKQASYSAVCKGNLRQWGIALNLYTGDYGVYPVSDGGPLGSGGLWGWFDQMQEYTGVRWIVPGFPHPDLQLRGTSQKQIHVCPSYAHLGGVYGVSAGSYGCNVAGLAGDNTRQMLGLGGLMVAPAAGMPGYFRPTRESDVVNPSSMIAISDSILGYGFPWNIDKDKAIGKLSLSIADADPVWYELWGWSFDSSGNGARNVKLRHQRHAGRWNVVFCDAHVQNLTTSGLFDSRQDHVLRLWNDDNLPHHELIPKLP
jgi:prepilin-type processing-associated H-X9-DG protein